MDRRSAEAGGRGEEDLDQAVLLWGKVLHIHIITIFSVSQNLLVVVGGVVGGAVYDGVCDGTHHVTARRETGIIITSAFNAYYYIIILYN